MTVQEVLAFVRDGWQVHYAPVSGAAGLWRSDGWIDIPVEHFLELRRAGSLTHVETVRQGHTRFHGIVDVYRRFGGA